MRRTVRACRRPRRAGARRSGPRSVASLALLAALAAAPAGAADPPARAPDPAAGLEEGLAAARAELEQGEVEIAESRYRGALREGWLLLGASAAGDGRLERAREAFRRAASVATDDRRAILALALVEIEGGRPAEAATLLRRLAARDPADVEVRQALARALAAAGSPAEAVQELEELRVLAPDDLTTVYSLATAHLRQGDLEPAEALLDELAERRPGPRTWVLIGRTYRDHGHLDAARRALETALDLDPEARRAHLYLGTVELQAEGMARVEEAIAHFAAEVAIAPQDPLAQLHLGIGRVETRRWAEAVGPLEAAAAAPATRPDALFFLGQAHLGLDRPEEAAAALREALELAGGHEADGDGGAPEDAARLSGIHYQLALALRRSGRPDEAAPHFEAARDSSARLAESSRASLSRYLADEPLAEVARPIAPRVEFPALEGLDAGARAELEKRVEERLAGAYLDLGVLKSRQGRFAGAAELFAAAAGLAPETPRVWYSLGVARFNAGSFEAATEPLARALEASPEDVGLRRMLALAHFNAERYGPAAELLRDDPGRGGDRALAYTYGVALVRAGRPVEAETVFARLLAESPDWPELRVVTGQAAAQQGDFEAAIASLRRALELDPGVAEAHATLGDIYLRQGRLDEAAEEFRAELAARPGDAATRYKLALALDLDRRPGEAEDHLRRHLEARPRSADGRYLLGKILLAGGSAEAALEQLEIAAELAPGDANVRYQLGQALQRSGRPAEAAEQFEAYRRLKRGGEGES